ncbi:aldehyde dehydrogenase, partial [Streptomyces sp. SID6013]|nr:aldehyde dehydrogenase [Streptomyces sp. SID6013]
MPRIPADEILIAGQWRLGGGLPIHTVDPADGTVLATVHAASPEDVNEAAHAAAAA